MAWFWILSLDVYDPVALSLPFIIDPIADIHWFSSRLLLWVRPSSLFSRTGCCFVLTFFHHRSPVFWWLWSLGHLFWCYWLLFWLEYALFKRLCKMHPLFYWMWEMNVWSWTIWVRSFLFILQLLQLSLSAFQHNLKISLFATHFRDLFI